MVSVELRRPDAFCFRVREPRPGWNVLVPTPGTGTVDLAVLLKEAPEFIALDSGRSLPAISFPFLDKDQAPGRLTIVLDTAGSIALAAAPAPNRESATALVRDALGAHVRFWRMPVDDFLKFAEQRLGQPVLPLLAERAGADWDEKTFRTGLEAGLRQGRFPLAILAAALDAELQAAATYLHEMNMTVRALGVEIYESWGVEILLPKVHLVPELAGKPVHRPMPPMGAAPLRPGFVTPPATAPKPATKPETKEEKKTTLFSFEPPPGFGKLDNVPMNGDKSEPAKSGTDKTGSGERVWSGTQAGVMAGKRPAPRPKQR